MSKVDAQALLKDFLYEWVESPRFTKNFAHDLQNLLDATWNEAIEAVQRDLAAEIYTKSGREAEWSRAISTRLETLKKGTKS